MKPKVWHDHEKQWIDINRCENTIDFGEDPQGNDQAIFRVKNCESCAYEYDQFQMEQVSVVILSREGC